MLCLTKMCDWELIVETIKFTKVYKFFMLVARFRFSISINIQIYFSTLEGLNFEKQVSLTLIQLNHLLPELMFEC